MFYVDVRLSAAGFTYNHYFSTFVNTSLFTIDKCLVVMLLCVYKVLEVYYEVLSLWEGFYSGDGKRTGTARTVRGRALRDLPGVRF